MEGLLAAGKSMSANLADAATTATAQAAAASRGTAAAAASLAASASPAKPPKDDLAYFSKSKLFGAEFDVESPSSAGAAEGASEGGGRWGSLLSGGGGDVGSAAAPGEGGAEATAGGGVFGMAKGALDSSMQSMGIGKKEETPSAFALSRSTRMKYFVLLLLAAGFCFSVSLTFLPFLPIRPQKFALMFSLGSVTAMGAIAMLKGPMEFVSTRLTSTELPFTVLYGVALLGTLYGALTSSYLLSALFSAAQFGVLMWHFCGAVPGGRAQQVFIASCMAVTRGILYPITRMFK